MLRFSAFSVTEKLSIFEAVALSIVRSEAKICACDAVQLGRFDGSLGLLLCRRIPGLDNF